MNASYFPVSNITMFIMLLALLLLIGQGTPVIKAQQQCTLTVSGSFKYQDRSGNELNLDNFYVELRNADSERLNGAWDYTSPLGTFSISRVLNPGCQQVKLFVRTHARYDTSFQGIDPEDKTKGNYIHVEPGGGDSNYEHSHFRDYPIPVTNGFHSLGPVLINRFNTPVPAESNLPAFWIKDDFDRGFRFSPSSPGDFDVQWKPIDNSNFDRFCYDTLLPESWAGCESPYIQFSELGPNSSYVVLHEMGHRVMYNLYGKEMPLPIYDLFGPDYISDCLVGLKFVHFFGLTTIPECIWMEDWAHFWAIAVNNDPVSVFVDDNGATLIGPDLEDGDPGWRKGDATEGRVVGALWDIIDSKVDGTDAQHLSMFDIWDSFTNYAQVADGNIDHTFEEFWETWRGRNSLSSTFGRNQCAATSIYQNTIEYDADGWLPCAEVQPVVTGGWSGEGLGDYAGLGVGAQDLEINNGTPVDPPGGFGAMKMDVTFTLPSQGIELLGVGPPENWGDEGSCVGDPPLFCGPDQAHLAVSTLRAPRGLGDGLAFLKTRLTGDPAVPHDVTLNVSSTQRDGNEPYGYFETNTGARVSPAQITATFARGDGNSDGVINIFDAVMALQFAKGSISPCPDVTSNSCGPGYANLASVIHNNVINRCSQGDSVTVSDATALMQYIVGHINTFPNGCTGVVSSALLGGPEALTEAVVTVGSAQIPSGSTGSIPISVTDIADPTGLSAYQFRIDFDPAVIRVDSLTGGDAPFGFVSHNIDNAAGTVVMLSFHNNVPGPAGDQLVANINFTAIGPPGSQSPLDITVVDMSNPAFKNIPSVDSDGTLMVE